MPVVNLRTRAVARSLFSPTTLARAIDRMGFVQADPIRAPARAQDLILRHRVRDYRAGDLEARYGALGIEEDYLYAYGFVPRRVWSFVHPRKVRLSAFDRRVLEAVTGPTHPRELEASFGTKRVVNAWGGFSKATTDALDRLQFAGHLRIARREAGIRVYERAPEIDVAPADERMRTLIVSVANLLAPARERKLLSIAAWWRRYIRADHRAALRALLKRGELERDGEWIAPPGEIETEHDGVKLLAPFDPIVWDRERFEMLWGWEYRFEAYTPIAKRVRGYYALPLLHRDAVIGWANARVERGKLDVDLGFIGKRPRDPAFRRGLDEEIARMEAFLGLGR